MNRILITGLYRSGTESFTSWLASSVKFPVKMYKLNPYRNFFTDPNSHLNKSAHFFERFSSGLLEKYSINILNPCNLNKFCSLISPLDQLDFLYSIIYNVPFADSWAEKNQLCWRELTHWSELSHQNKGIHIIKDPLSVAISFKNFSYCKSSAHNITAFNILDSFRYYKAHMVNPQILCIKFESLTEVNAKFKFLEVLNWLTSSMYQKECMNLVFPKINSSKSPCSSPLTSVEFLLLKDICSEVAFDLGYTSLGPPISNIKAPNYRAYKSLLKSNAILLNAFEAWYYDGKSTQQFPIAPYVYGE